MKFEPGNLQVRVVDIFSVILPGGILAFFLGGRYGDEVFGVLLPPLKSHIAEWVAFILAAYLFGHLVFMVGSLLDMVYNPIRERIWGKDKDLAYQKALEIKLKFVGDSTEKGKEIINPFQWAKALLILHYPGGMIEVAQLEADSKFFRSLFIVVLIILTLGWSTSQPALILGLIAILVLSYCRYVGRRHASTQHAYWYVITLDSQGKLK